MTGAQTARAQTADASAAPTALEFAPTVRFVRRPLHSLVVDLETRRWVRLGTRGLEAVEARLGRPAAAPGNADPATTTPDGDAAPSPRQVDEAVTFLHEHGFLRPPGTAAAPVPRPPAARTLHLHVTHHCNLACPTCYAADFLRSREPDVLGLDDLRRILDVAARAGFRRLTLSGGEPLLRRDLAQVLDHGRRRFESIALTTNGTALTPRRAAELVGRVDRINVSLDGVTAEIHDAIRGPGAFQRTLDGLRTLLEAGFPARRISLSPTVTQVNHATLDAMVDLAASFGTDVAFGFFMPTGRGLCNRDRLTLDPKDMMDLFERAAGRRRRHLGLAVAPQPGEDPEMAFPRVCTDCSIDTIVTVQADGSVFPCPNLIQPEHRLGNVLELDDGALTRLLTDPSVKETYRRRTVDRVPGCRGCEARHFCGGGCMANAYMVTDDLYGKDPYCGFYREVWFRHGPLQEDYAATRRTSTRRTAAPGGPP